MYYLRRDDKQLKIIFVCEGLTESSVVAQPWKHVFEIAKRVIKRDNDVQILTDQVKGVLREQNIGGVPVRRIKKGRFSFDKNELLKILNDEDVDVINWHGSDTWSALRFSCLRKSLRKNVVWTLHSGVLSLNDLRNLNVFDYFQLYKFWNNIMNAMTPTMFIRRWMHVPFLRHIITLSKRTAARLNDQGIHCNITYIPSGVDTHVFKPSNNSLEESSLLYFGPLSSFRGVDTLLSAFKLVKNNLPNARLIILAREPNSKSFWFKKAESLGNVEVIAQMLDQKELILHLNRACLVVLPFKFWPQVDCPLTILEAMALGKPVVTTSTGAISEIVTHEQNGILIEPGKPKILANAVIRLLKDGELAAKIGKNAQEYVMRVHDWDVILQQTLEVFQAIMK